MKKKWLVRIALCGLVTPLLVGCGNLLPDQNNNTQQNEDGKETVNPVTPAIDGIEEIKVTQVKEYSETTKNQIKEILNTVSARSEKAYEEAIALLLEAKVGPEQIAKAHSFMTKIVNTSNQLTESEVKKYMYDALAIIKSLDVVALYDAIEKRIDVSSSDSTLANYVYNRHLYDGK